MYLRQELREARRKSLLDPVAVEVEGLSLDDEDNPIKIKVNDLVISLQVYQKLF